ncbi:DNA repair protein RecN [Desulfobulbus alkaliphilus]|uniref:DNA repair protein RecN n=1 Tax=Desulfobulbus alkaliphilus TaxID=869814 RepID=UPI0019644C82|nr:DNA repair protein RecN [Desulfobulbus alkaliphilus]MBM9536043.1 DNA repair protein RecN [Desulfobulbus alkaliphilus]
MLQELRVHNLALIDSLHLDLADMKTGLIVFTGETGAGKSIILQSINLLTGGRGTAAWIRGDCGQAGIEALFSVRPDHAEMQALLNDHALINGSHCLVRRILSREGRSRLFINDQSVTTRLAGAVTAGLINVASQHDHQQLLSPRHHLDYLDDYGELHELRQRFTRLFRRWQQTSSQLRDLREKEQDKEQQRDYLRFQLDEINRANITVGEEEQLSQERDRLKASDTLIRLVGASRRMLAEAVTGSLVEIRKNMEQAAVHDAELLPLAERIGSVGFELEDLDSLLRRYLDAVPVDPARLEIISGRLAELKQLRRKYGATLEDVLAFARAAETDLARLDSLEEEIGRVERKAEEISTEAVLRAAELTQARRETATRMAAAMERELVSLSFSQAVFQVRVSEPEELGMEGMQSTGRDIVEFFFSANPGIPPQPLARIVSGGELSRLMLAMKCLLARKDQVDTVIFDEVDAGIGGQAAEAVAEKISELAGHHQVLCITHLPQIAACADLHFKVEKRVEHGLTQTMIHALESRQRVEELARMLGGATPTAQTLKYAQELMTRKARGGRS